MESSIKIDFKDNGKGLQPVIAIKLVSSDDVRDSLLQTFFQQLGGQSSWLSVSFDHHIEGRDKTKTFISIVPVTPDSLQQTAELINSRLSAMSESKNPLTQSNGHTIV